MARKIFVLPVAACLSGVLLHLAVPATLAEFRNIPGNAIFARLEQRQPVFVENLPQLLAARQSGDSEFDEAETTSELALAQALTAIFDPGVTDAERDRLLAAAIENQRSSLAKAPHAAVAWLRLAVAEAARNDPVPPESLDDIFGALRMSHQLAPYSRRLALERLALYLSLWDAVPPEDRPMVEQQAVMLWEERATELLLMTERAGTTSRLRPMIARSLADLQRFQRLTDDVRRRLSR